MEHVETVFRDLAKEVLPSAKEGLAKNTSAVSGSNENRNQADPPRVSISRKYSVGSDQEYLLAGWEDNGYAWIVLGMVFLLLFFVSLCRTCCVKVFYLNYSHTECYPRRYIDSNILVLKHLA